MYQYDPIFMIEAKFEIKLLEEAMEFLENLDENTRDKVLYNMDKARHSNNAKLFKKLRDEIWEFRTFYSGEQYRLLAFWTKENKTRTLVVATHGIVKKTDKMPDKEIKKAIAIRNKYLLK